VRDRTKQNLPVDGFDIASLNDTKARKHAESERTTVPTLNGMDLEKFKASKFDIHEVAFLNLLSQHRGLSGEPLHYVFHVATPPAVFANDEERRHYALNLAGPAFDRDNQAVYRMLKLYLIITDGWVWISGFDSWRTVTALTLLGLAITLVKESSTNTRNWQSNRFNVFITRMREPFHLRNTVLHF
jgi:hypothetical protein